MGPVYHKGITQSATVLEYLNLKGYKGNLFETMLLLKSKEHLVKDIFTLKAVYLKD